ncbi:MAG TPA: chemotaxis response regulator protein-glutamate methylesterase [Verrucomicrobiales bacterium]|nr:chemotaxis response regulator protein-glutamate methylesterase [Verrucomicrobiales bacterium]
MNRQPVKVLIVDDSAVVRRVVSDCLGDRPEIEIVGTACNPYDARDKILNLAPDVVTLDLDMPLMDGLTFLRLIMQHRPMPVVILSSLTATGSRIALEALQAGAVDIMEKPSASRFNPEEATVLVHKIVAAAASRVLGPHPELNSSLLRKVGSAERETRTFNPRKVILIGASTGGTEAIRQILAPLPPDLPGIAVVQHIPAAFSGPFASRLNELCRLEVREARHGDLLRTGTVLIAPGGRHLALRWTGSAYEALLGDGPKVHHQRPAVDVLFESAVKAGAGPHALGVLLTGMGADGAAGLLRLKESGGESIAQDEASCVVFGMPREAIKLGAARQVLPLKNITTAIDQFADSRAITAT